MVNSDRKYRPAILFLCTGNSCRSQMAEGWARFIFGDQFEVYSAGIETHGLNPRAVQVMAESGVDISDHYSKRLSDLTHVTFTLVVTVCDHAHESCPLFSGNTEVIHRSFEDPPRLAGDMSSEESRLNVYRRVRDEIRDYVHLLEKSLLKP